MEIEGQKFKIEDIYNNIITIPDCFVFGKNKLGVGHGEAKLYLGSKNTMRDFFGNEGFSINCFLLKSDLLVYLNTLKQEYLSPSQDYVGKADFPNLWKERINKVNSLPNIIKFSVTDQKQIAGIRGYVNSKNDGYNLIRELSLPLVTYISIMKLVEKSGALIFYWKLFVDYEIIYEKKNGPLVFYYGKKTDEDKKSSTKEKNKLEEYSQARIGQGQYRQKLLEECPYCPITMLSDERLLIASHIKPWALCNDKEKTDPKNGYILSPLYDKLFDKGFITFTEDKHMLVSNWLSQTNMKRLNLKNNLHIPLLPMDEKRIQYLKFHINNIFKK
uniref:HNH endonuclease n=1 Tax=Brachyspira catarrhinii TaxID=2528966 RepID=UPI003F4C110D